MLRPLGLMLLLGLSTLVPTSAQAASSNRISLIWTTTGDDGSSGIASHYDVRYSTVPITEANFYLCPRITSGVPLPSTAGNLQVAIIDGLPPLMTYYFAMKVADERLNWSAISNVAVHTPIGSVSTADVPLALDFSAAMPNPARHGTRFEMALPQAAPVRIEVFDLAGRKVRTLVNGLREAGRTDVSWNLADDHGRPVEAGVYLVRADLPGRTWNQRAVVVR